MALTNNIFNLPSAQDQIRTPEEIIKISTRQIIPKSNSTEAGFPGSNIVFDWTTSGNQYWIPSRSYVRIRDSIYIGRNTGLGNNSPDQPLLGDDMAGSLNLQDNLFDGCQLTVGGFSLGSKTTLAPQISVVNKRITKSAGWLNGVGKTTQNFNASFQERQADISSDGLLFESVETTQETGTGTLTVAADAQAVAGAGTLFTSELIPGDIITSLGIALVVQTITSNTALVTTESTHGAIAALSAFTIRRIQSGVPTVQANRNERIYQPPLGVWSMNKAMPPARYELTLRPKPDLVYKQCAIQTSLLEGVGIANGIRNTATNLPAGNMEYVVDDIVLFVAVAENFQPVPAKQTYVLDLNETEVLPRQISGGSVIQENFTVSKSTQALAVALQSKTAGASTLFPPSLFKVTNNLDQNIKQLQVSYGGQTVPNPQTDSKFEASDADNFVSYINRLYVDSSINDLSYFDTGGALTADEWRKLGMLMYYEWRRIGDDISTNVDVQIEYPQFVDEAGSRKNNLLLFHFFRRVIEFTIEAGQVTQFLAQDA